MNFLRIFFCTIALVFSIWFRPMAFILSIWFWLFILPLNIFFRIVRFSRAMVVGLISYLLREFDLIVQEFFLVYCKRCGRPCPKDAIQRCRIRNIGEPAFDGFILYEEIFYCSQRCKRIADAQRWMRRRHM